MKKGALLIGLLVAIISACTGAWMRLQRVVHPEVQEIKETVVYDKMTGKMNVLIVGEDNVEETRRSDTIALAAIDLDNQNVRILSLPRDTRMSIPGKGWQKVNHAFAYGGVDLLRTTVSNALEMPIHYYVLVNYDTFPRIVDMLGGVTINVQKKMRYIDRAGKLDINIPAGQQHLDGLKALHYVRFRHDALGDIGRVARQQIFIKVILDKLKQPEYMAKIPQMLQEMAKMVQTDFTVSQALQMGSFVRDIDKGRVMFMMMPGKPEYINKISYWISDIKGAREFLTASIDVLMSRETSNDSGPSFNSSITSAGHNDENVTSGDKGSSMSAETTLSLVRSMTEPVAVLNGTGVGGLSRKASEHLQKMGVEVTHTGNAKHYDYRYCNIIYPENASQSVKNTAKALGALCNIPPSLVRPARQAVFATIVLGKNYQEVLGHLAENYASMK